VDGSVDYFYFISLSVGGVEPLTNDGGYKILYLAFLRLDAIDAPFFRIRRFNTFMIRSFAPVSA
jgi:hypothetical protein